MNDVIMWIIIGVVCAAILAFVIYLIVRICKMSAEDRKALILNFLKGAVVAAEEYIGSGHGDEKLQYVEDYFNKKAPWFLKILFFISGQDNLKDLIEEALAAVEGSFGKNKPSSETKNAETNSEEE